MRRRQIWNRKRYKFGASGPDKVTADALPKQAEPVVEKTPAELYEEKFGKKPHGRMKPETILEKLKDGEPN